MLQHLRTPAACVHHLLIRLAFVHRRASYAPLLAPGDGSPLSVTLAYVQTADPASEDIRWFAAMAQRAFTTFLARLRALPAPEVLLLRVWQLRDGTGRNDRVWGCCLACVLVYQLKCASTVGSA